MDLPYILYIKFYHNTEIKCQNPHVPANGWITPQKDLWTPGDTVRYACNSGYKLEGKDSDQCDGTGRWRYNMLPTCTRMYTCFDSVQN